MLSEIDLARLTGFLFLFVLATSFAGSALAGAAISVTISTEDPDEAAGMLRKIAKNPGKQRASVIFNLLSQVGVIALAGTLFLTFSPYNLLLALLGTLWRVAEGVILASVEINNLVLLGVAQAFVSADGAEAVALETMGRATRMRAKGGFTIGVMFFALGSLMYGILFVSSIAVPLWLGWLGVVSSTLVLAVMWLSLARSRLSSRLTYVAVTIILYELALGFWLLLRGAAGVSP